MTSNTVEISNKTKGKLPRLPFVSIEEVRNTILGKKYELSIAVVGDALSKKLNNQYRGKNHPTNILSFSLTPSSGEIVLNLKKVKAGAREFGMSYPNFLGFLLIHGMLHLKGFEHGSTMEAMERKFRKKFNV